MRTPPMSGELRVRHIVGSRSPLTSLDVHQPLRITHSRPESLGLALFKRIKRSPSSVFMVRTGSSRHDAPSGLETDLKFKGGEGIVG